MFREEAPLTDVIYRKDLPLSKTSNGNLKFSVKVSKYLKLQEKRSGKIRGQRTNRKLTQNIL